MERSNVFSSIPDYCLEERLFAGIFTGPLEGEMEGVLDALDNVDVRMPMQRTALHMAVSLGKADWVRGLLERGADPALEDGNQVTPLTAAEEMEHRFPEDTARREVLGLVQLVHRRDQAIKRRRETPSSFVGAAFPEPLAPTENVSDFAALRSSMEAFKREIRSTVEALGIASTQPSALTEERVPANAALYSSIDNLKKEVASLRAGVEELKRATYGRDTLLSSLETAVTSSAEDLTSLRVRFEETVGVSGSARLVAPVSNPSNTRWECVEAMMGKTVIMYRNACKVSRVRGFFERLYDEDISTACILKFLCRKPVVQVMVDCDSKVIQRMKEKLTYFDGSVHSGSRYYSFPDFSCQTVYLGAKEDERWKDKDLTGELTEVLTQMALFLAFGNEGKPYERGDAVHEEEYKRALREAEGKKRGGVGLHMRINWALNKGSHLVREIEFAPLVPWIIALEGYSVGSSTLGDQVPLLYHFYKDHVMPKLLA